MMIGGRGSGSILSDVWLCDTNQWNKVLSPFTHEFSYNHIVNMLTHCVLTGAYKGKEVQLIQLSEPKVWAAIVALA